MEQNLKKHIAYSAFSFTAEELNIKQEKLEEEINDNKELDIEIKSETLDDTSKDYISIKEEPNSALFESKRSPVNQNHDVEMPKIHSSFSFTSEELNIKKEEFGIDIKYEELDDAPEDYLSIKEELNSEAFQSKTSPTNQSCDVEMQNIIIDDKTKTNQFLERPQMDVKLLVEDEFIVRCDQYRYSLNSANTNPQGSVLMEDISSPPSSSNNSTEIKPQVKEKKFMCQLCKYKTNRKDALKIHMRIHTGEKDFPCTFCDYKTTHKSALRNHIKTHTGERDFHCKLCDYKASQSGHLKHHMKTHTGERNYNCNLCDYKAAYRSSLKIHMKTHTGERNYHCNLCDYKAAQSSHLKYHMKTHTGERNYNCNLCDYKAVYRSSLRNHMKTHTGERNYHCNLCDYKASQNSHLKYHMKTHTKKLDLLCNICDYKTTRKCYLTVHMRIHTEECILKF